MFLCVSLRCIRFDCCLISFVDFNMMFNVFRCLFNPIVIENQVVNSRQSVEEEFVWFGVGESLLICQVGL